MGDLDLASLRVGPRFDMGGEESASKSSGRDEDDVVCVRGRPDLDEGVVLGRESECEFAVAVDFDIFREAATLDSPILGGEDEIIPLRFLDQFAGHRQN